MTSVILSFLATSKSFILEQTTVKEDIGFSQSGKSANQIFLLISAQTLNFIYYTSNTDILTDKLRLRLVTSSKKFYKPSYVHLTKHVGT